MLVLTVKPAPNRFYTASADISLSRFGVSEIKFDAMNSQIKRKWGGQIRAHGQILPKKATNYAFSSGGNNYQRLPGSNASVGTSMPTLTLLIDTKVLKRLTLSFSKNNCAVSSVYCSMFFTSMMRTKSHSPAT